MIESMDGLPLRSQKTMEQVSVFRRPLSFLRACFYFPIMKKQGHQVDGCAPNAGARDSREGGSAIRL